MEGSMVVIRKPKIFSSNFDFPKDDKNSKHKTELIIRHNECLAENTIKKKIG